MVKLTLNKDERIAFISDTHFDSHTPMSRLDDILETSCNKMEDILNKCVERNVKAIFFEGDIFNRIATPHSCINRIGSELLKFKGKGIRLFSILGNHDIVRNNLDDIERSPIQTLFTFGVVEHINLQNKVLINNDILITPVDYTEYPEKADKAYKINILLAHMFYNQSEYMSDSKHNLSENDTIELMYDYVILGHDHQQYDDEEIGNTVVIRHGSLLRGTAHDYNFERKPNFLVFNDLNNISLDSIEKVEIEHKPYKDVASNYVLNKKHDGSLSGLKEVLSNLADKLSMNVEDNSDRILDIIKSDNDLPIESKNQILNYITELL